MHYREDADSADFIHFKAIDHLLINHKKLFNYIFHSKYPRLISTPEDIIFEAGVLSCGEQVLVQMVLDLWDGSGKTNFIDAYHIVGNSIIRRFFESMDILTGNN